MLLQGFRSKWHQLAALTYGRRRAEKGLVVAVPPHAVRPRAVVVQQAAVERCARQLLHALLSQQRRHTLRLWLYSSVSGRTTALHGRLPLKPAA